MEVSKWEISMLLSDTEPLSGDQFLKLCHEVHQSESKRIEFADLLHKRVKKDGTSLAEDSVMSLKVAQGLSVLGKYAEAIDWLDKAGSGKQQSYLKACCLRELGQYDQAVGEFEQAESKGHDSFDVAVSIVGCIRLMGNLEEAKKRLKRISRIGDIRSEYHFQLGRLNEAQGLYGEAIDEYERAVALDGDHVEALFRLAYMHDLYSDEGKAIEYYQQCINRNHAPVSALLNLAVLHEDREDYYSALSCVKKVLRAFPNHKRARMYLKDIESSVTMYYDEDQERRVDRRNKVLEIPISDFELSVRSRNCLKKMNIKTLGDLLQVTETELLAYKNFGETSLQEIKTILTSKGLRLGQMLEEHKTTTSDDSDQPQPAEEQNEVLSISVNQLQMSVRSRKCLEHLNIENIGDLTRCTEAELLGCKNFGMTSLNEIKQALRKYGQSLRRLED